MAARASQRDAIEEAIGLLGVILMMAMLTVVIAAIAARSERAGSSKTAGQDNSPRYDQRSQWLRSAAGQVAGYSFFFAVLFLIVWLSSLGGGQEVTPENEADLERQAVQDRQAQGR